VLVSSEHADFFTRNLAAICALKRIAPAQKNAASLTYGDFGNVAKIAVAGLLQVS
jgi:hypothetical protein